MFVHISHDILNYQYSAKYECMRQTPHTSLQYNGSATWLRLRSYSILTLGKFEFEFELLMLFCVSAKEFRAI